MAGDANVEQVVGGIEAMVFVCTPIDAKSVRPGLDMLQRATELAMSDLGLMPVHFQFTIWATKKNVNYIPRTDEYTLAFQFKPAKAAP